MLRANTSYVLYVVLVLTKSRRMVVNFVYFTQCSVDYFYEERIVVNFVYVVRFLTIVSKNRRAVVNFVYVTHVGSIM